MNITYKTEIKPTARQILKIRQMMRICCWIYNQYIKINCNLYKMYQRGFLASTELRFMTVEKFERYVDVELREEKKYLWLKECGNYTRKMILINAENAFKSFLQKKAAFPRLKIDNQKVKIHLRNKKNDMWVIERHRINIPTLGFIRLKEYGYLPVNENVLKGIVSAEAGRYYITIIVKNKQNQLDKKICKQKMTQNDLLTIEDRIIKIIKKINREKRSLSRKYENEKDHTSFSNIEKQKIKIAKLEKKLQIMRKNYKNEICNIK